MRFETAERGRVLFSPIFSNLLKTLYTPYISRRQRDFLVSLVFLKGLHSSLSEAPYHLFLVVEATEMLSEVFKQ